MPMRFPNLQSVALPATLVEFRPGRLHPSGIRYLPLLVLRLADGVTVGVVDRHHRVDARDEGQFGTARLVFQLSSISLQPPDQQRSGIVAGPHERGAWSSAPTAYGQIVAIPTWEQHHNLRHATVYTEIIVNVGAGTIGLRTNITDDVADDLFADDDEPTTIVPLAVGDWVLLCNSRIDILEFGRDHP